MKKENRKELMYWKKTVLINFPVQGKKVQILNLFSTAYFANLRFVYDRAYFAAFC